MYITRVRVDGDSYPNARCYPFNVPALRETIEIVFESRVVFFVGENGSGKSTLLEAVARKCGIHIWDKPKRHIVHANPYEARLADYVSVTWANGHVAGSLFRAETFRDLADFLDDVALCDPGRLKYHGGRIINMLSHGEGILSYLGGRCQVAGLYILDEPEAALSPLSQVAFVKLLQRLEAAGRAQFIIATHSPILLAYPGAQIFSFDPSGITQVSYEETTHYQVYEQFLADPERFLKGGDGREK